MRSENIYEAWGKATQAKARQGGKGGKGRRNRLAFVPWQNLIPGLIWPQADVKMITCGRAMAMVIIIIMIMRHKVIIQLQWAVRGLEATHK